MKKNSIIEMQAVYVAPTAVEVTFENEGLLCASDVNGGFGAGGFEGDDDNNVDFF